MSEIAESRLRAGRGLFDAGNFAGAERMLKEALSVDPDFARAHALLSLALYRQGKDRAALDAAQSAIAIDPNADGFRAKALALIRLGKAKEAVEAARASVAQDPQDELASLVLGFALEDAKAPREAEVAFRHAVEIAPSSAVMRANLGRFLLRRHRQAEAQAQAEAIDPTSDDETTLLLRGEVALLQGRTTEARDFALWVLSINATSPAALRLLTQVKASRSLFLGLWWRYSLFMATRPVWLRALVVVLAITLLLPLLHVGVLLLLLYLRFSGLIFAGMVRQELKTVTLKKSFLKRLAALAAAGIACAPAHAAEPTPPPLVDAAAIVPRLATDIRYAGSHNFTGAPVAGYEASRCWLTREAATALARVQTDLAPLGFGLKAYDCYRPVRAVRRFVAWAKAPGEESGKREFYPDVAKNELFARGYIAAHSSHSRGSTVDVSLIDRSGRDVDMGTPFDFFGPQSHPDYRHLPAASLQHRAVLRQTMRRNGFVPYEQEWWHFTLADEPFPTTAFDMPIR